MNVAQPTYKLSRPRFESVGSLTTMTGIAVQAAS
jgi:hypothetical protein